MSEPPKAVSIRTLYVVLIVLAILATTLLVGIIMQRQADKAAIDLQKILFTHVAHSVSEHVTAHFDHGRRLLDELSYRAEAGGWDVSDPETIAAYFAERLRFQKNLAWISIGLDETGCFAGAWLDRTLPVMNISCPDEQGGLPREFIVEADGTRVRLNRRMTPYDPRTRPWYQTAAQTNTVVWTDLTPFHEGRMGVTAAKSLRSADGRLLGVITVDFFTETIQRFLTDARPGTSGLVFLFNGTQSITPEGISTAETNAIQRALDVIHGDRLDARLLDIGEEPHMLNMTPLPDQMNGNWSCAVLTPRRELIALAQPHQRFALWSVMAVCFSVLLAGAFITIRIAKPLRSVSHQLRSVAKGQFDDIPADDLSLIREVRYIQQALEYMKQCLKERNLIEKAKLQAEQLSRDKSDFAAMISHEVRSPIQIILGYSELLQSEHLEGSTESREYANTIYNSALELLELVNNLLDLFKIEAGRYDVRREPVALNEVIVGCINALMLKAKTKGIGLVFQSSAPGLKLTTDPVMLRQIIANFLTNAIKFTEAGSVTVGIEQLGPDLARVQVRDTGIGMTPDEMSRIFSRYDQASPSIARHYGGTGLGLSICLKFATMLHGTITCTSEPGRGSCFVLELPLKPHVQIGMEKP
jgi:signal transduction histidine kinase